MQKLRPLPVVFRLSPFSLASDVMVRERIMIAIRSRLEKITIANGYSCDCGTDINEGKIVAYTPEVPSLNFWDGDETCEREGTGMELCTMRVTVELYEQGVEDESSDNIAR